MVSKASVGDNKSNNSNTGTYTQVALIRTLDLTGVLTYTVPILLQRLPKHMQQLLIHVVTLA